MGSSGTGTGTFVAFLATLATVSLAAASPVWLDETAGGAGHAHFGDLSAEFLAFFDSSASRLTFDDLPAGTLLAEQYRPNYGVSFLNAAGGLYSDYSRLQPEGGPIVEDLTGYDTSYMPDGDMTVVRFGNDDASAPFTIVFDQPVSRVGAFIGTGVQGGAHTFTVSLYNAANQLLSSRVVTSWLWEGSASRQNYETFFAAADDSGSISRVEILNDSHVDFANALVLDNVTFARPDAGVPEPLTVMLLAGGGISLAARRTARRLWPS